MTDSTTVDYSLAQKSVDTALRRLITAEPEITNYDTIAGDGDCGIGLKRGAEAILKMFERSKSGCVSVGCLYGDPGSVSRSKWANDESSILT